jgi:hypothetical protein
VIRYIRQSQFSKFLRCRRSWEMEYVRGLEMVRAPDQPKGARSLGSLVHLLVEDYYTARDWRAHLVELREDLIANGYFSKEWQDIYSYAEVMMLGYVDWLAVTAADANEEVIAAEGQLEAPMGVFHGDDVVLTGKPDALKRDVLTDLIIIEDTKTVQAIETETLIHGYQLKSYGLLTKLALDLDVNVGRLNQLRKVKRTGTAKPPFYGRSTVVMNKDMLRHHYSNMQGQLDEMVKLMQYWEEKGLSDRFEYDRLFYPTPTSTCKWDCDFLAPCKAMDDGSNAEHILTIHYRQKPANSPEEPVVD